MKFFSISLIAILCFSSCKKDETTATLTNTTWEWKKSRGGIAVQTLMPAVGVSVQLQFQLRSRYQVKVNSVITCQGNFHVTNNGNTQKITLDNYITSGGLYLFPTEILTITDSTFVLFDDHISDGFMHEFVKVN